MRQALFSSDQRWNSGHVTTPGMLFAYYQDAEAAFLLRASAMIGHKRIMPVLTVDRANLYCFCKNVIHVDQVCALAKIFLSKGNLRTEIW